MSNKSALVVTDRAELTDKRLDPKETLIKAREENQKLYAYTRKPDQDMLSNLDMATGQPMEWRHLVFLLNKMIPGIIIRDGRVRDAIALRIESLDPEDQKGYGGNDDLDGTRYITGFYKDVLPEFTCEVCDDKGRPTREIRGWRTVLIPLIKNNLLSYKDAVAVFGEPNGQRSGRWQDILRQYRA